MELPGCYGGGAGVEEEEDVHELDLKDACHQCLPSV